MLFRSWQKYKESLTNDQLESYKQSLKHKNVSPFSLLNMHNYLKDENVSSERMSICEQCEFLIKITKQCRKCGCMMSLKTKLKDASCPIGKWDAVNE